MAAHIRIMQSTETQVWDTFVRSHPHATLYHLSAWQRIIQGAYNLKPFYLMAVEKKSKSNQSSEAISGVLPLVHLKSFIFGNKLVSLPFFDMGGVLADDADTEQALIAEAIKLGKGLTIDSLELRQLRPVSFPGPCYTKTHKFRMLLDLPESSEALMKGFKSKLRSQIKKAVKEGLETEIGGLELLDDFYAVFLVNMRDLGSPVHSKRLMENVLKHFLDQAKIMIVRNDGQAIAGSIVVGFRDVLENPWASSLRRFSHLNANMLLYWAMLEYACDRHYRCFDFGRSTLNEGTFNFKAQWGARPLPLCWQTFAYDEKHADDPELGKSRFSLAIRCWKRIPVTFTTWIGPRIRKHIGL